MLIFFLLNWTYEWNLLFQVFFNTPAYSKAQRSKFWIHHLTFIIAPKNIS